MAVTGVLAVGPAVPAGAQPTPITPVAGVPILTTAFATINNAYNKAQNNISSDIAGSASGPVFTAGDRWKQAWTRDTSYASDLGVALVDPKIATVTLQKMIGTAQVAGVSRTVWVQDTAGHFGTWPNMTDSIVGAVGAWSVFQAGGDTGFLADAYGATSGTLQRAETDVLDAATGLFRGDASFMDSYSAYPSSYWSAGAYHDSAGMTTEALSINALYYRGYRIAAEMAQCLGQPQSVIDGYNTKANNLKAAINTELWNAGGGYYAYYLDADGVQSDRMEGLGESLAMLWGVASPTRAAQIRAKVPQIGNYAGAAAVPGFPSAGIPSLWPQYSEWVGNMPDLTTTGDNYHNTPSYYHDGMIWPFVQAYWGLAAASHGDVTAFSADLGQMLSLSGATENYTYADGSVSPDNSFHEFYQPDGTPDGSASQLWSGAGFLGMVYQGLFGINLTPTGMRFSPVLPGYFNGTISTLGNLAYRNATLNIAIHGAGTQIRCFLLDGTVLSTPTIRADLTGTHTIDITMAGSPESSASTFTSTP